MKPRGRILHQPVILLVEDEPHLRAVEAEVLHEAGLWVLEAQDAAEAFEILKRCEDVRVVLTDVAMPGSLNGFEFARLVAQGWPYASAALPIFKGLADPPYPDGVYPSSACAEPARHSNQRTCVSTKRRFLIAPSLARLIQRELGTTGRIVEAYFVPRPDRRQLVRVAQHQSHLILLTQAENDGLPSKRQKSPCSMPRRWSMRLPERWLMTASAMSWEATLRPPSTASSFHKG